MTAEAQAQDSFDEAAFLNEAQEGYASFDTSFVVADEGDYTMSVKQGSTKIINGNKDGRNWRRYTARVIIDDAKAREKTGLEAPGAAIRFFLDLNEAGTALASGVNKNVNLNRLLVATGNAKPGWSFAAIEGVPFKGHVRHDVDKDDASKVFAEVDQFGPL